MSARVLLRLSTLLLLLSVCALGITIHRGEAHWQRRLLLPQRMLWVWERSEDLRRIDPSTTGVAVLEETLRLGAAGRPLVSIPRAQPVVLPEQVSRVAVVRIETVAGFSARDDIAAIMAGAVQNLAAVARRPGLAALQIDFDARRSEQAFYRRLLERLHEEMPAEMPLTITALASWCSTDDWIADLQVEEATPMFFRMEPDRRRLLTTAAEYRISEPLCQASVGVSTGEPWPQEVAGRRVYIFADYGWARDMAGLR